MPRPKLGLRVKFSDSIATYESTGKWTIEGRWHPAAWYIMVRVSGKWRAITNLPFAREKDATRAVAMLTAANLDTEPKMRAAGCDTVKQVACEFLQW